MYRIESDSMIYTTTRRREAFRRGFQLARQDGHATLYDGLLIEPLIYFDFDGAKVTLCHCGAEARLMRAIFNQPHPDACDSWIVGLAGR